jgi:hypothetical protein
MRIARAGGVDRSVGLEVTRTTASSPRSGMKGMSVAMKPSAMKSPTVKSAGMAAAVEAATPMKAAAMSATAMSTATVSTTAMSGVGLICR